MLVLCPSVCLCAPYSSVGGCGSIFCLDCATACIGQQGVQHYCLFSHRVADIHAYTHTRTHTHTHTQKHTNTHRLLMRLTHVHTHRHTQTHSHTHTQLIPKWTIIYYECLLCFYRNKALVLVEDTIQPYSMCTIKDGSLHREVKNT